MVNVSTGNYGTRTKDALKEALKAVEVDMGKYMTEGPRY
jgi:hypothetical protein